MTIRRDEVEARVLKALQEKLLNQELFEDFCDEFTREMNCLRMERRASLSPAKREVERINTRIQKLLNLLLDDEIAVDEGKAEIETLDARRKDLSSPTRNADERPPLLHPEMADLFRQNVTTLAQARNTRKPSPKPPSRIPTGFRRVPCGSPGSLTGRTCVSLA